MDPYTIKYSIFSSSPRQILTHYRRRYSSKDWAVKNEFYLHAAMLVNQTALCIVFSRGIKK